jgi:hypothetical protein
VHYTDHGAEVLAQSVAASIRAALQRGGDHKAP